MSPHFHCQDFEHEMSDLNYMFIHNYQIKPTALDNKSCSFGEKKWEDVRSDIESHADTIYQLWNNGRVDLYKCAEDAFFTVNDFQYNENVSRVGLNIDQNEKYLGLCSFMPMDIEGVRE